ncbi:MAG: thioredoxin family protein [Candidatus Gracilibacteria bacterium]|nr:thioredoxin family protein [Candidatus Gracilibacteria bacterium]
MKTKLLIGTGILFLGLTSCSYFAPEAVDTNIISEKSGYDMYDMSKLSQEKVNIIQFHADWCPNCISLEKDILANTIPENINILKVDYDNSTDLKEKYGVTMQHTSVQVDGNGEMIKKWAGAKSISDLVTNAEIIQTESSQTEMMEENVEEVIPEMETIETPQNSETSAENFGEYREYDIALLSAKKANILQFHADWCPSCVRLEKELNNTNIPSNLNILKVDYDNEMALREKYGISMQHISVLVDANGEMIKKWSGAKDIESFTSQLN